MSDVNNWENQPTGSQRTPQPYSGDATGPEPAHVANQPDNKQSGNSRTPIIIALVVVLVIALCVGGYLLFRPDHGPEPGPTSPINTVTATVTPTATETVTPSAATDPYTAEPTHKSSDFTAELGQEFILGDWAVTVFGGGQRRDIIGHEADPRYPEEGAYLELEVRVTNLGDEPDRYEFMFWEVEDTNGNRFNNHLFDFDNYAPRTSQYGPADQIPPGESYHGPIYIDVPPDAIFTTLYVEDEDDYDIGEIDLGHM